MRRFRWFALDSALSIRKLANRLQVFPFTAESADGFLVTRVRETFLEARFIERTLLQDAGTDPLGNEFSYERVTFKDTTFRINSTFPQLELENAPRGNQAFSSRLAESTDFSVAISVLDINVASWATLIHEQFPDQFFVDSAQVSGLEVETGVKAKIVLSGSVDVRSALSRFAAKKNPVLDRLTMRFAVQREQVRLQLTRNGSLTFLSDTPKQIVSAVKLTLSDVPSLEV